MRKPYLIRTPAFSATSGGIRVMYGLYGWLLAKGEIAYLNTRIDVPSVGVYPEIYSGNDMEAQTVVRYILQTVGKMGTTDQTGVFTQGPTTFDPTDKIYVFSKIYDTFGVKDDHILFLPIINTKIFKDLKKNRTKTCYLVGKGTNTHQHPEDSIELTREFANDQSALAELLNECHTLYCYDFLSAMMDIARLCGCKVRYLGGLPQETLEQYEPGTDGIDFGNGAHLNSENFRYHYTYMRELFSKKIDKFIESTQYD